ncbi:MAG: hypothetical protein KF778_06895 [Rhodocyclaceae bacterium]|nr:hypothetical protein [Rhodocyclaceae bacterium]MBX3668115.1 hypothetical protein [Rhodocyclaceae bacterium]
MHVARRLGLCLLPLLAACSNTGTYPAPDKGMSASSVVKTDIDRVLEAQQLEVFAGLKRIAEKLYRRNPREFRRAGYGSVEAAMDRLFQAEHNWRLEEFGGRRGTEVIVLAFQDDFAGDRVAALVAGLGGMIRTAYQDRTELFVVDELDPQALYNAARNVEIAIWRLSNKRDAQGELYILSNAGRSAEGEPANLSYEREFGKIIAHLDFASRLVADKNRRVVVRVVQTLATAVLLPVH